MTRAMRLASIWLISLAACAGGGVKESFSTPDAGPAPATPGDGGSSPHSEDDIPPADGAADARPDEVRDSDGGGDPAAPFEGEGDPWLDSAPRATCGSGDVSDETISGLDGDVRCNLEIAGQVDVLTIGSIAWYQDCLYVNGPTETT